MSHYIKHIFLCTNQKAAGKTCCANTGLPELPEYLKSKLQHLNMYGPGKIRVSQTGCLGRCNLGPCIVVYPEGIWYTYASFSDIDEIVEKHLQNNQVVERLLIH